MARRKMLVLLVLVALAAAACTGGDDDGGDADGGDGDGDGATYSATIQRTSYGIPHITADDVGSLAFGQGYAFAEDHLCSLADQVVKVRSERARFFGPGEEDEHIGTDFAYLHLGVYERAEAAWDALEGDVRDLVEGYAAGYNAYLDETGAENVGGWCAGEEWVRPVTPVDLVAYYKDLSLLASGRQLLQFIADAQPPGSDAAADETTDETVASGLSGASSSLASNGWAIGSEDAEANGLLLANPHFPWRGEARLWESHLTIPDEYDVYGASLLGVPGTLIGFNDAVAWTHTVSDGNRMTAYRLGLVDGDPTSYLYDGEPRAMESQDLTIEVLGDDGTVTEETRTLWSSHYGPMLSIPGFDWTAETAVTYRDANIDNDVLVDQFFGMGSATSLDEFIAAHEEFNGIPWVNTMAVSADGQAWYADTSATPNLSDEAIERWLEELDNDLITGVAYDEGFVVLDGSDSAFEWVEVDGARSPGLVPFAEQPQLLRDDYIFNANDSFWLANPDELLTGYSPLHGMEETPRSLRTRMNAVQIQDSVGDDGIFTLEEVQDVAFSNRAMSAELLLDGVVSEVCEAPPALPADELAADPAPSCAALAAWDGRFDLDSVGAGVWRLFIEEYSDDDRVDAGMLFGDAFDPADPVGTPSTPAFSDPEAKAAAWQALGQAAADLEAAGFSPDTPYGDLHFTIRADERIPIHGGPGNPLGISNSIDFRDAVRSTLEPTFEVAGPVREESSLTPDGWPVNYGTSFIMTLEFTDDGPRAQAILTYSESGDPESEHYADQTKLFSEKTWRDVLFTDDQISDDVVDEKTVTG